MPSVKLGAGSLRVQHPESYTVRPYAAERPPQVAPVNAGRKPGVPTGDADQPARFRPSEGASRLTDAFARHRVKVVEQLELVPAKPSGPAGAARGRRSAPGRVRLELDLPQDQNAVVLLEQDGVLRWKMPTGNNGAPKVGAPGLGENRDPASRIVRFEITVLADAPTGRALRPLGDPVVGRVTAYVLRFAARFVPGAVLTFLERHTHRGLVLVTGDDPDSWKRVDNLREVPLPDDRPAKILLLVHGTFSDTVGSFGMIPSTAQGQRLLTSAAGSYDAVIGFDHRTLSRDPLENAIDLQARLDARHLGFAPTVDIISYSRGALVARSLIEYLLPSSTVPLDVGAVIFVGGTNAGTKLADPENWESLLDLYTNLAMATARSVERLTDTAMADQVLGGLVGGLVPMVKYLSLVPVAKRLIPGLAAMDPDGPFITGINATQQGQPVAGTPWYVVSSDFESGAVDETPGSDVSDLFDKLALRLADGLADALMGAANDLVVDTASMQSVDLPSGGGFVKDSLSLGANPVVHHLNYFVQPSVCAALRRWLS